MKQVGVHIKVQISPKIARVAETSPTSNLHVSTRDSIKPAQEYHYVQSNSRKLSQLNNKHFCVLYGNGIDDSYLGKTGIELSFQRALYEELRSVGFKRIVFSAPHKALYYLDFELEALSSYSSIKNGFSDIDTSHNMIDFIEGPMGQYLYLDQPQPEMQTNHQLYA